MRVKRSLCTADATVHVSSSAADSGPSPKQSRLEKVRRVGAQCCRWTRIQIPRPSATPPTRIEGGLGMGVRKDQGAGIKTISRSTVLRNPIRCTRVGSISAACLGKSGKCGIKAHRAKVYRDIREHPEYTFRLDDFSVYHSSASTKNSRYNQ